MWHDIDTSANRSKEDLMTDVKRHISDLGYEIVDEDLVRPWGGFFRFAERHNQDFKDTFFPNVNIPDWAKALPFSPKILVVAPQMRLSWQYHDRRGEVWSIVRGPVSTALSDTDEQPEQSPTYQEGDVIDIPQGTRHRMIGLNDWGIWAEMWVHTDPDQPSEETDNHRLADDFGRN